MMDLGKIHKSLEAVFDKLNSSMAKLAQLSQEKLDLKAFEDTMADFDQQLETNRFATLDCFRTMEQTDNYIEKYLPFKIQNLISENILSFLIE